MWININEIKEMTIPGMNGVTGAMSTKMDNDDNYRIITTKVHLEDQELCEEQ